MFFPKTTIDGLSTQSSDFKVVFEFSLQLFKLTLLNKVTTPFRLNSWVLYKSTPIVFVPILYCAQTFKGKTVFIFSPSFPWSLVMVIGACFQTLIWILSS